jgi:hypothetical protein
MPAWLTVKTRPATVMVPVRSDAPVLAAALKPTVPLAVPLAPLVTVIHETVLAAVQPHPAAAATVTVPVPPPTAIDWLAGLIVGEQGVEVNEN